MICNGTITDYDIQALVDNELDWEEEKRILTYIASNAQIRHRYEELREQKELLKLWWIQNAQ